MPIGSLLLGQNSFEKKLFTENPEFSFFVDNGLRNVSEFSMEDVNQYFINDFGFGKRSSCFLNNNSDLINNVYLIVKLPSLPEMSNYGNMNFKWKWVENIGHAIIKNIDIEIGNNIVQSFSGTYIDIYQKLRYDGKRKIDKLIGNTDELTTFTVSKDSYKLYIPIPFWFTIDYGNSLPIIKFDVNKVKINVEFENFEEVIVYGPTNYIEIYESDVLFKEHSKIFQKGTGAIGEFFKFDPILKRIYYNPLNSKTFQKNRKTFVQNILKEEESMLIVNEENTLMYNPLNDCESIEVNISGDFNNIISAYMQISYIFIGENEQKHIKESKNLQYLIQQTTQYEYKDIVSRKQNIVINGKNPCYEISWVCVTQEDIKFKKKFQYSNMVLNNTIFMNGFDILSKRSSDYCRVLTLYENYPSIKNYSIYTYSFSKYPNDYQPSGSVNLSKIDKFYINLELDKSVDIDKKVNLYLFVNTYNIATINKSSILKILF